jgi:hypothetical protein
VRTRKAREGKILRRETGEGRGEEEKWRIGETPHHESQPLKGENLGALEQ